MGYKTWNGPMPTTAAQAAVSTGTSIKTMLQVGTSSTRQARISSWGFSIDGAANGYIELLQTDVAATVTAHVASGIINTDPNGTASLMTLGTSATGYTGTAEGTITAVREFAVVQTDASAGASPITYEYQFMPDERPIVAVSKFLRVRATMGTSVGMVCWVCWDEI